MLRIDSGDRRLVRLQKTSLEPTELPAAPEIRALALASASAVIDDLDEGLFLLGADVPVRQGESPRADLLCAQQDGSISIFLFPREGAQQLSLALTMSGELARRSPQDLTQRLPGDRQTKLREFLSGSIESLNRRQKIVLVSGMDDPDLGTAVEWLRGGGVAISLLEVAALKDSQTKDMYLTLSSPGTPAGPISVVREVVGTGWPVGGEASEDLAALTGRLEEEEEGRSLLEQRYRTVSRLAPIGVFHTDAKGDYLFVNQRWMEIAGLTEQEAAGQGWMSALHPEDKQRVLSAWSETFSSKGPFKAEFRFLRPDGVSWVIVEAGLQTDSNGTIVGAAGTVTELHRSRLGQQDERNRSSMRAEAQAEESVS